MGIFQSVSIDIRVNPALYWSDHNPSLVASVDRLAIPGIGTIISMVSCFAVRSKNPLVVRHVRIQAFQGDEPDRALPFLSFPHTISGESTWA
jgi:hypothetical protein